MLRKSTDFWESEYNAHLLMEEEAERERTRKALKVVNAQRRPSKIRPWQVWLFSLIVSLLVAWYALFPLAWRIFR